MVILVDETDGDIILQEEGTNQFIELFNFQLEDGTTVVRNPMQCLVLIGHTQIHQVTTIQYI